MQMLNELKFSAYIVAAFGVLALFFQGIVPMLLKYPPTGANLFLVALTVGLMLYVLSFGPLWILEHTGKARRYIRAQLSAATVVLTITVALCVTVPVVPSVASALSGSFAGAALLLRAVVGESKARAQPMDRGLLA